MTLLYFAWLRQKLERGEETMALPDNVKNLADLAAHLAARGGAYGEIFGDITRLRAAVNQTHEKWDTAISDRDEIAFFPPVTGG